MATITITVTVSNPGSGNKYYLDGALGAYAATPGNTYKFDQADGSNSGHPLRFATAADAAGSSEYTTGVTTNGTPGSAGAYTQIEVTATTTQALFFYCTNHSGMGDSFNVGGTGTVQLQTRSGFPIQNLSSDPVPYAQALANDPYAGVWSSGGNLNQARYSLAGAGTQTAGLAFGGYSAPSRRTETEEYNGTSWSEQNNLNLARNELTGAGTQTAALAAGGYSTAATNDAETYNGTSWTEIANLNTARDTLGSTAMGSVNTAVYVLGGANVESWNGSSWTETTELNTPRGLNASAGTTTSGITIGGSAPPGRQAIVESWNGSAWTEVADLSTATSRAGAAGASSTAALSFGGETGPSPDYTAVTESFNGSSWTTGNSMSTARYALTGTGGAAPNAVALAAGGYTTTDVANTEEWSFSGLNPATTPAADYSDAIVGQMYYNSTSGQFKGIVVGVGTWASGGNVNTARGHGGGAGDSNSANLFFGGQSPGNTTVALTENYNGTAWTEVGDLNQAQHYISGTGSSTAAIVAGGNRVSTPGGNYSANAETWDGSSWTEVANLNVGRSGVALFGTSTSAIGASGYSPATSPNYSLNVEQWNGSAWTEIGDVNYGKYGAAAAGTSVSAGLAFGGENSGMPSEQRNTESWNGSAWTEVADMATTRSWVWSGGTSTDALVSGGQPGTVNTELFDGTSWTEVNNLATERRYAGGKCGTTSASCMWVSGVGSPPTTTKIATTEEWTKPDFTINPVTTS